MIRLEKNRRKTQNPVESELHRNSQKNPNHLYAFCNHFEIEGKKNPCCASFSKTSAADKLGLLKYFGEEEVDERRSRCSGWPLM